MEKNKMVSNASRRGKKMLKYFRDKNEGTYRSGEGEEEPATSLHICDPGSESLLGGRREDESNARIMNWMEKKKWSTMYHVGH